MGTNQEIEIDPSRHASGISCSIILKFSTTFRLTFIGKGATLESYLEFWVILKSLARKATVHRMGIVTERFLAFCDGTGLPDRCV